MAASSSSASANILQASPQVYINFRGADLRFNFISHLEKAFGDGDVNYFIDSKLTRGQSLESLFNYIEESKIALVIFSKGYSQSRWCLRELTNIMKNVRQNKTIVIPIFFDVEVEDVKHRRGEFGLNLYRHSGHDISELTELEETLKSVPTKVSLTRKGHRTESEFIVNIVLAVKEVLVKISPVGRRISEQPTRDLTLYGVEERLKQLEEMFVGMRSIVKTDLADMQVMYEKILLMNIQVLKAETFSTKRSRRVSLPPQHQVFISFRGELRNNFISHLVGALKGKRINVFIDTQEKKGEDISHLLTRIEDSRIAIVVFSSKYTDSTWCLKEAEKIKEVAAQGKLKVIPIFYKVTPTNVKLLTGDFGDNFREHKRKHHHGKSVNKKWKEALKIIAHKIGFELNDHSDENNSIALIVQEVLRRLTSISFATQTTESHVNQFFYKGETSKNASHGISSNESSSHCYYTSTSKSDIHMSGFPNLFGVGPNQSNYTTDNRFPGPWRDMTTSHCQPTNPSWGEFSDESSDDDSSHGELYLSARQLNVYELQKKMN